MKHKDDTLLTRETGRNVLIRSPRVGQSTFYKRRREVDRSSQEKMLESGIIIIITQIKYNLANKSHKIPMKNHIKMQRNVLVYHRILDQISNKKITQDERLAFNRVPFKRCLAWRTRPGDEFLFGLRLSLPNRHIYLLKMNKMKDE